MRRRAATTRTRPRDSVALWSPDGVTWSSYTLEGEAYEEPGISPDGQTPSASARTLHHAGARAGSSSTRSGPRPGVHGTATITDAEQVSYLYGTPRDGCRLVVLTRTGNAVPTGRRPLATSCSESGLVNVDSDTAWLGDLAEAHQREVVSRADATSPWAVTGIAPA